MRNVMICVSVMLAVFLGWPLAFGGHNAGGADPARSEIKAVTATAPAAKSELLAVVQAAPAAESCYKRYQREVKGCSGADSAACRLKSADNWDLCEATGFWPN